MRVAPEAHSFGRTVFAMMAGTVLATSPALAQSKPPTSDNGDIIVTAQKREESLQKVPISIQALSAKKLEEHQVTSFDDYAKLLPSVSFQSFGPGQSQVYFRGITSGGDGQHNGSQPTSALYVDEIPLTTVANTVDLHIYDMQRVEALSGPQGTLFGSSSLAGTLRLITNKPDTKKFSAGFDMSGTTFGKGGGSNGGSFDGFVNIPINQNIAFRASAFYEYDGGYISNTPHTRVYNALNYLGNPVTISTTNTATPSTLYDYNYAHNFAKKNFNTTETYGGRAALGIDLDESWTVTPTVIYQHQQANGAFLYDPKVGDLQVHDFTPDLNTDEWTQAALTIHGKLSNWDVTYVGGYFERHVDNTADYSYYTVDYANATSFINSANQNIDPTQIVHGHDDYTKQSHELRVSSPSTDRFRLTAGLFYQRQTDQIVADYIVPGLANAVIPGNTTSPAVPLCGDDIFCTRAYRVDRDYAMFADASFDILPNLTINGGMRGFIAHNTLQGYSGLYYTPAPCTIGSTAGVCNNFNTGTNQSGETHRLNLTWKVDRDHMVYATYSTGYRPGGINRTPGIPPYNADTLTNYEIGFKTAWLNRKLYINGAILMRNGKVCNTACPSLDRVALSAPIMQGMRAFGV